MNDVQEPGVAPAGEPTMDFSTALAYIKDGFKAAREGWNGRGMFVYLAQGSDFVPNRPPLSNHHPVGTVATYRPHIDMRCADGTYVPWLASQSDLLSDDWVLVP